jgi:hypothetical protein
MTAAPTWASVDDDAADLLALVANDPHPSSDFEWREFVTAVEHVARRHDGRVPSNALRPLVRGVVAPKRIGSFTRRALLEGLIVWRGEWQVSDDTESRNAGRPVKVYELAT